jgi:endonuclease/exonuclease/phosphatase family metal-dependent hydrolase
MFDHWEDASAASPAPTIPAGKPTARIDYVLLRPPGAWRVQSSEVLAEPVASDHRPLLVELLSNRAEHRKP